LLAYNIYLLHAITPATTDRQILVGEILVHRREDPGSRVVLEEESQL
jgi:hypothetical protein